MDNIMDKIKCGLCHYDFDYGVQICQGCTGTVVYGATQSETSIAFSTGAQFVGIISLLLMYGLPLLLNAQFSWSIGLGWSLGLYGIIPCAIVGFLGGIVFRHKEKESKKGLIRTFK